MKLSELINVAGMEENAERLKKIAELQANIAKASRDHLMTLKAQPLQPTQQDTSTQNR